MGEGTILDAAVASSEEQRRGMWRIRDRVEHLNADGIERAFDVSVPLAKMDGYVREALDRLAAIPGCRAVVYGHIGDNNLHWNTTRLDAAGNAAIDAAIYEPLAALNGSVSAEHGIGLEKRAKLKLSRSPEEIAVMRLVKRALDPDNRLNPGKIF
ncbi:hypothetical protein GOFOIKOB_1324 [Methylobacterium tardum]|uniref:FAD-binding oxidoreductase/transferase type 4 C-terminal domain-containing protein n=2 Tax=Methylobacterium tardum TaxID=374432 RepID=A0AA37TFG0_9HYPH|nr:hypothetical protein GOFOIKOB_1324 [Methylobacterium tardum]GLS72906.1 hypothetical protein GCM10007890_49210 [Methylobacterium tardum]